MFNTLSKHLSIILLKAQLQAASYVWNECEVCLKKVFRQPHLIYYTENILTERPLNEDFCETLWFLGNSWQNLSPPPQRLLSRVTVAHRTFRYFSTIIELKSGPKFFLCHSLSTLVIQASINSKSQLLVHFKSIRFPSTWWGCSPTIGWDIGRVTPCLQIQRRNDPRNWTKLALPIFFQSQTSQKKTGGATYKKHRWDHKFCCCKNKPNTIFFIETLYIYCTCASAQKGNKNQMNNCLT